ncbi:ATP-binding protein [Candidatus Bathyarchaeota archaeon]|nr:ATP-binding protein [Candidatus Bathyarchaeota archaeon]
MGLLWLIGFIAISIMVFFICILTLGSCITFLSVPILLDHNTFSGLTPFIFLIGFGATAFIIVIMVLPLYSFFLHSVKKFCQNHTVTLTIKSLKFTLASTAAYFACFILSALHIAPIAAMLIGFTVLLVIMSQSVYELFIACFSWIIPLVFTRAWGNNLKIVNSNGVALLGGLLSFRYCVIGFVKVNAMLEKLGDVSKLRDALFGLYAAKVPVGYCVGFREKFSLYFFTYAESLFQRKAITIVLERLTILKETLSSQLPELNGEIVQGEEVIQELVSNLARGGRIQGFKGFVKTFREPCRWEIGGIGIEGAPAYKGERFNSLVETLLNLKLPALYVVTVQPITGFQLFLARCLYRNELRDEVGLERLPAEATKTSLRRRKLLAVKDLRLFRVGGTIWLGSETRGELRTALWAVKSVVKAEFSSEWTEIKVKEIRGFRFSRIIDQLRLLRPKGKHTILTASEAAIYIRLPSDNIPGVENKAVSDLAVPKGTQASLIERKESDDELILGQIIRNGRLPQQIATLPTYMLCGHLAIFGASRTGKSNFVKNLVLQLIDRDIPILVIDAHNEYVELLPLLKKEVWVIDPTNAEFSINILELPENVDSSNSVQVSPYVENATMLVKSLLPNSWGPILESLARESLYNVYLNCKDKTPTFGDWLKEAEKIANARDERYRNALDSFYARLMKFQQGWFGQFFNQRHTTLPIEEILEKPTFIQLRGLDNETQNFLAGSLFTLIVDYRKKHGAAERLHVTILEEAHLYAPKILRASSSLEEMSRVPASLFLAEAAKFNHSLILVDQFPSRVAEDAIVNCSTLVTFRVFYDLDKRVILAALGYDLGSARGTSLGEYLTTLEQGHAIVRTATSPYPFEIKTELIQIPAKTKLA